MDFAPQIIKCSATDAFDLQYKPIEFEFSVDDALLISSREKFFEIIDTLKKDKIIKSTLELSLQIGSNLILCENLEQISDWYMVSEIQDLDDKPCVAEFQIENNKFRLVMSSKYKCPRCWKFNAKHDGELCPRCEKVLKNV